MAKRCHNDGVGAAGAPMADFDGALVGTKIMEGYTLTRHRGGARRQIWSIWEGILELGFGFLGGRDLLTPPCSMGRLLPAEAGVVSTMGEVCDGSGTCARE
jgi:hypothetical protein